MLSELCKINGVSGDEKNVAEFILSRITAENIEYEFLKNGTLIVYKKGKKEPPFKFMIFAHMDEVGFIVSDITEEGYIKFESVGAVDKRVLLSKKVVIGDNKIPGVIGVKAVHLTSKEERKKCIEEKDMYIDIGALSRKDALNYVSYGDYIAFNDEGTINKTRLLSKALDDRIGVSLLLELVNSETEYSFIACFDVMEELGCFGAATATNFEKPDYALVLEGTTCSDINGTPPHLRSTVLGNGPALSVRDMGASYSDSFNKFIKSLADKNNIKYQLKQTHRGANDSNVIECSGKGTKVSVISLPLRYIHSPGSIADLNDYNEASKLIKFIADNIGDI